MNCDKCEDGKRKYAERIAAGMRPDIRHIVGVARNSIERIKRLRTAASDDGWRTILHSVLIDLDKILKRAEARVVWEESNPTKEEKQ